MDKQAPTDFDPYREGDMQISGADIPKSTVAVAACLWAILFAMQSWHLITTLNMKDKQTEQSGDMRVMQANSLAEFNRINANLDRIEEHNRDQDKRIGVLEVRR